MMAEEVVTSGFVDEGMFTAGEQFSNVREFYSSASGYNRLFRCERYGKVHVLKTLQPFYANSVLHEQALRKEFNIGYQLEHPHICHTLGWEQVPGLGNCILMEYIDGVTLKELMEQGRLTDSLAYKIIGELCEALSYLHNKQIIHRDLKPGNILITHNGNNVKLVDFSLSDCDDYDILKMPAGTRYYLAPEVLQTDGVSIDLRADIYSLGVVIGEMASLLKDKKLAAISRRCTQRKREKRYQSAAEVVMALKKKQHPAYGYAAIVAVVVAMSGVVGGALLSEDEKAEPMPLPVYGNVSESETCRRILAEERIRLNEENRKEQSDRRVVAEADSLHLMLRLREALDADYPLPVQRRSEAYHKQWERLKQEAEAVLKR